ncbi:hypothetical protein DPMN_024415 [Dreissena polymorpha]|uniref:Uncharacterized protein n=1 Tax=Dreissena polymorpha TaxID=45954 RepID=A0A9D4LME9_DREPO|nr:hypothetical protein DPMN_024415 [Dreissena polymorpha]
MIFELIQDIIETNLLTKFHEDWTINVASRVLTSHITKNAPPMTNLLTIFHQDWTINVASRVFTRKNAPPPGGHFHEDWTINVACREKCPTPWQPCFSSKGYYFELIQDISGTNLLSKKNAPRPGGHFFQPTGIIFELIQDNQTINVASRVLTRFYSNVTIFELIQDIIETNLLTKFYEDWTINVASRELTRQMLTQHNAQKVITKAHHEHVVLR